MSEPETVEPKPVEITGAPEWRYRIAALHLRRDDVLVVKMDHEPGPDQRLRWLSEFERCRKALHLGDVLLLGPHEDISVLTREDIDARVSAGHTVEVEPSVGAPSPSLAAAHMKDDTAFNLKRTSAEAMATALFGMLDDGQRVLAFDALFNIYCKHCGCKQPVGYGRRCQCWNDE